MATYNANLTQQDMVATAEREPRPAIVTNQSTQTKPPRVITSDVPIVRR